MLTKLHKITTFSLLLACSLQALWIFHLESQMKRPKEQYTVFFDAVPATARFVFNSKGEAVDTLAPARALPVVAENNNFPTGLLPEVPEDFAGTDLIPFGPEGPNNNKN